MLRGMPDSAIFEVFADKKIPFNEAFSTTCRYIASFMFRYDVR